MLKIISTIVTVLIIVFCLLLAIYYLRLFKKADTIFKKFLNSLGIVTFLALIVMLVSLRGIDISYNQDFIELFSLDHIFFIYLMVLLFTTIFTYKRELREDRDVIYRFLFVASVVQQICLYGWYYLTTDFDLTQALPMEISRITTLLNSIYLATKKEKILDVNFYFSIFALASFAVPTGINDLAHVLGWSFFINHAITLSLPFIAYYLRDFKPKKRYIYIAYAFFGIYIALALLSNEFTGGNYFFIEERVLGFLEPIPKGIYIFLVFALVYAVFNLIYVAFTAFINKSEANLAKRVEA